jgi:hypothetical protein
VVHRGNGISGLWFFDRDKGWRCLFGWVSEVVGSPVVVSCENQL